MRLLRGFVQQPQRPSLPAAPCQLQSSGAQPHADQPRRSRRIRGKSPSESDGEDGNTAKKEVAEAKVKYDLAKDELARREEAVEQCMATVAGLCK